MAGKQKRDLALQELEDDVDILEHPSERKKKSAEIKVPKQMILRLVSDGTGIKRRGGVNIDGIDDVTDPNTGETRRARLIRGATSIWQDEQYNFPKEYVEKNRIGLQFENETCILGDSAEDVLKKKFAAVCNSNMTNENRSGVKKIYFEEWNPAKISERELNAEMLVIEAMQIAASQPYDKMVRHANYLGVSLTEDISGDDLSNNPLKEKQIRKEYMLKAKREPKAFMDSADAPIVKIGWLIKRAIKEAKIDTGKMKGQAYWANGGFICAIPTGMQAEKYLIEFAMMPREESIAFVNQLKTIFNNQDNTE